MYSRKWCITTTYTSLRGGLSLVNALPTISNVWKKVHVAATTSSSPLSASHNALPDHQRETKMANVLGEDEPFVIFWGSHEYRWYLRYVFEIGVNFRRSGVNTDTCIRTFCIPSGLLKWKWPNEVLFSSCGGCGSDRQPYVRGYGFVCRLFVLITRPCCDIFKIYDTLACSVSSNYPFILFFGQQTSRLFQYPNKGSHGLTDGG